MTFGQARLDSSHLLVVQPYIDSWIVDTGGVEGFNLGVLALTPVPANLTSHTITYYASGKSTGYKSNNSSAWKGNYNRSQARHITADDGDLEQAG